jgi:hypothetical protein
MGHALTEDDLIRWSEFQMLVPPPGREQSSTDIPTMVLDAASPRNRDGRIQPCGFEKRRSVNSSAAACGCSRTIGCQIVGSKRQQKLQRAEVQLNNQCSSKDMFRGLFQRTRCRGCFI